MRYPEKHETEPEKTTSAKLDVVDIVFVCVFLNHMSIKINITETIDAGSPG